MSGVDVLAVMDDTRLSIGAAIDSAATDAGVEAWDAHLYKHHEARSAVAELIEAIKPFAALDLRPDGFDKRDDSQPVYARDKTVITVGDVRRASAALTRCRGGES